MTATTGASGDRSSFERVIRAADELGLRQANRRGDDVMVQCPAHDDAGRPSLHVTYKPAVGQTVLICFAACETDAVVERLGLTMADLFDAPLPATKRSTTPRSRGPRATTKTTKPTATPAPKVKKVAEDLGRKVGGVVETPYLYCDADGVVLGRQVRHEQRYERGHTKRFVQQHPGTDGEWVNGGWSPRGLYRLPEIVEAIAAGQPIIVCEGEKDADSAVERLELPGTTNCGGAPNWTTECAEQLTGAGEVWLILDRDQAGYLRGLDVPATLTGKVGQVRCWLPAGRDGVKDLTDHLDAGLTVDDLIEVPRLELVRLLLNLGDNGAAAAARWLAGRITGDQADLAAVLGDEAAETLQLVVERTPDGQHLNEIQAHLAQLLGKGAGPARATSSDGRRPGDVYLRPEFALISGELFKLSKRTATGDVWKIVFGCEAVVERTEYADMGEDKEHLADPDQAPETAIYVVRFRRHTDDGVKDLGVQRVSVKDFPKGEWLTKSPAVAGGVFLPATRAGLSDAAEAILNSSVDLQAPTPVYKTVGWRQDADGWYYVHAGAGQGSGAAITTHGQREVRTHLSGPAAYVSFPHPPQVDAWRAGVQELVHLMDQLPDRIGAVLVGLAARAAVGWTGTSLVLSGDYEAGKTSLATLLGSFYDPTLPWDRARMSLAKNGATAIAARRITNRLADCIALLDDANPDDGTAAAAKLMALHARAQYGGVERDRATRGGDDDASLPPTRSDGKPRGTQVMTGELSPGDAGLNSAESRIFPVRIGSGEVAVKTVMPDLHSTRRRNRRSDVMAGLIQWMAGQLDEVRTDLEAFTGRESDDSYTKVFDDMGMPTRLSRALADYLFGWRLWLAAAIDAGALDDAGAEVLWNRAFAGLVEAGRAAQEFSGQSHYDGQMREYLASALNMGDSHLIGWGQADLDVDLALACGWKEDPRPQYAGRTAGGELLTEKLVQPSGRRVGWVNVDERRAYLDPEAVLRICTTMAKAAGTQWDTTRRVVGAALLASNRSRPEVERVGDRIKNRSERRIRDGIRKVPVWDVDLDWLLGLDDDDPRGDAAAAPPVPVPSPPSGFTAAEPAGEAAFGIAAMAVGAENIPIPWPAAHRPAAAVALHSTTFDKIDPAVQPARLGLHVGVHPIEVMRPEFDLRAPEQMDRCITCGDPCAMRFGQIVLHPSCELPTGAAYDDRGQLSSLHQVDTTAALFAHGAADDAAAVRDAPAAQIPAPAPAPAVQAAAVEPALIPGESRGGAKTWQPWRALAAVADVDGLHLADGDRVDLPADLRHLGQLAQAGIDLNLGWGDYDEHWQPERGQIWLTSALARKVGLPAALPPERETKAWKKLGDHPWLAGAAEDGWQFGQKPDQPLPRIKPWTTIWRPGGRGITVAVPEWTASGLHRIHTRGSSTPDEPTAQQLAQRIERYAALMGRPYYWSHAVTGLRILQFLHRDPRYTQISRAIGLPAPALDRHAGERELIWHRPPTEAEASCGWVHGYDVTAMYLAGANSLSVGLDVEPDHLIDQAISFDAGRPGFWRLAHPVTYPGAGMMPTLDDDRAEYRPVTVEPDGSCWVTTPTLGLLVRDWKLQVSITEAYLWPVKAKGARIFDSFYEAGRDALYQLSRGGSEEDKRIRTAVKATYTDAIGRLAQILPTGQQPGAWWRPDWQQAIVANSAAKLLRVVAKVGAETGRWPLAIVTDCLYYASDDPNSVTAAPQGLPLDETQLGKFKRAGSAPMAKVIEQLTGSRKLRDFGDDFSDGEQ